MITLTPPWYTLQNELFYTIGATPYVSVGQLAPLPDGSYTLPIMVCSCLVQAEALRTIIPESFDFGGVKVFTQIYFNNQFVPTPTTDLTTPSEVATLFYQALYQNPLFVGAVLLDGKLPPDQESILGNLSIVILPYVIQFYNDDLSDLCSNFNEVATKVFSEVLKNTFGTVPIKVSFSTFDCNCTLQKQLFMSTC